MRLIVDPSPSTAVNIGSPLAEASGRLSLRKVPTQRASAAHNLSQRLSKKQQLRSCPVEPMLGSAAVVGREG